MPEEQLENRVPKKGSRRVFPSYRSTVLDIIRVSKSVPSFPLIRTMQLDELCRVRRACPVRIAWSALFVKAYGIVCMQMPELRELYVRYPRKLLYLHPFSVASISVHRLMLLATSGSFGADGLHLSLRRLQTCRNAWMHSAMPRSRKFLAKGFGSNESLPCFGAWFGGGLPIGLADSMLNEWAPSAYQASVDMERSTSTIR